MNHAYTGWQPVPRALDSAAQPGIPHAASAPWSGRRSIGFIEVVRVGSESAAQGSYAGIGEAEMENVLLVLQHAGRGGVGQDGRSASCTPDQAAMYTSGRPFTLDYDAGACQTVLILPAAELRVRLPHIDQLVATVLPAATPAMEMVRRMAEVCIALPFDQMDKLSQAHAARALLEAVLAALALVPVPLEAPGPRMARFHMTRIKEYVTANLHDPELSVGSASKALRISPSHIHRLFESGSQTFSTWMWAQRLAACRKLLEDPSRTHIPVSQVAYSQGFNNASHFARMFRARYGSTPSAWRASRG